MSHSWIDSHCHIESCTRNPNVSTESLLSECQAHSVDAMITVGTSPADWKRYQTLATQHPQKIHYTVGLHPCDVDDDWHDHVSLLAPFFIDNGQRIPVAIGEIGLDYFHLPKDPSEAAHSIVLQKEAFLWQTQLALQLDAPIVVHSRGAFQDCIDLLDRSGIAWHRVVFHCFSEDINSLRALKERGAKASFTGIITYKNAGDIRAAALEQGIEDLMLETDAPYLTPIPHRGKRNTPAYTQIIGEYCAELFGVSAKELAEKTWYNTHRFFGL